jgi:hypothetical protein
MHWAIAHSGKLDHQRDPPRPAREGEERPMKKYLIAVAVLIALAAPAGAQANPQQQKMTECNAQAKGMTGDARKSFMGSCLSGPAETKGLHCTKGKPCGNSCIAQDKVCYK